MTKYMTKEEKIALYETTSAALITNGHVKFVSDSLLMYQEFKEHDGAVTCEFSTRNADLDLKMIFLNLMSAIDDSSIGYWYVYWCDTCVGHNPEAPFHCDLVRNKH